MDVPPKQTSDPVVSAFDTVTGLLSAYGWTFLFIAVVLNLLWSHFAPKYRQWKNRQEDQRELEELARNPDAVLAREEAIQRARQKLQEKHDQISREHAEKLKQAEERKRQEKIENYERLMQGKSKIKPSDNSSLKQDYNPLMGGGGSSCGFRPSRRLGGGGGGGGG